MTPWEDLAQHWRTEGELQVHETIIEGLSPPCVVIIPDEPWIEPGGFSTDTERYLAYAVASSATAPSAQRELHRLLHFMRHHLIEGWDFTSAGAPAQRENQGITYMAAEARLTFNQCTEGDPYEGASS